jgi:hypothetical protein
MNTIIKGFTAYTRLMSHIKAHAYMKGAYKGDAPADYRRRAKSHFRVISRGDRIAVHFHNTDILTAYPDGHLILDCSGWADSPTTKDAMGIALGLCYIRGGITSKMFSSKRQLCYYGRKDNAFVHVIYYDGLTLDSTGEITSELKPFRAKRRDRVATKEFEEEVKASGFKDMFKILHHTCDPEDIMRIAPTDSTVEQYVTNEHHANQWKPLVATYAWDREYHWDPLTGTGKYTHIKRTASSTWTNLTNAAKKNMYEVLDTDTFKL